MEFFASDNEKLHAYMLLFKAHYYNPEVRKLVETLMEADGVTCKVHDDRGLIEMNNKSLLIGLVPRKSEEPKRERRLKLQ